MRIRSFLFLLLILFIGKTGLSQNPDSLLEIFYSRSQPDTVRFDALHGHANKFLFTDVDTAIKYGFIELKFARDAKLKNDEARAYRLLARAYSNKFDYKSSLDYYMKGLKISEATNDYKGLAASYNGLGAIYSGIDENRALEYRLKSVEYAERSGEKSLMATCYLNIGGFYMTRDNGKSLEYKNKALKIYRNMNDVKNVGFSYTQIGNTYLNMGDNNKALEFYKKGHEVSVRTKNLDNYDNDFGSIGMAYNNLEEYSIAIQYLDSAWTLIKDKKNKTWQKLSCLKDMEEAYAGLRQYDKAYLVKVQSQAIEDSLFSEDKKKEVRDLAQKFENEKKVLEEEKAKIKQAEEEKRQRVITITILVILLVVSVFSWFLYKRYKLTNAQRKTIELKNLETEKQKHLIEEKQKEIIDSISYAKRLQEAILPPQEFLHSHIKNNFIYYKPKDIVAGDFYWAEKAGDLLFIAAADSTGHGVPGAMVSVVCSNALNRAIKEFRLTDTGKILDKARELVLETFEKSSSDVKDGMDISLLCIDSKSDHVSWSGANNPLWYIQNDELKEIKADKQPIGKTDHPKPFTTHQVEYEKNTVFYLFTDGLADQFGGPKGKKFKYRQFADLLLESNALSLEAQAEIIDNTFRGWQGELEQVDDVCVIGIRL